MSSTMALSSRPSSASASVSSSVVRDVTQLVRTVDPDELGNVKGMLKQFKGREGELVEELKGIQGFGVESNVNGDGDGDGDGDEVSVSCGSMSSTMALSSRPSS